MSFPSALNLYARCSIFFCKAEIRALQTRKNRNTVRSFEDLINQTSVKFMIYIENQLIPRLRDARCLPRLRSIGRPARQAKTPPHTPKMPYTNSVELRSSPTIIAISAPKPAAKSPEIRIPSDITIPLMVQAILLCLSFVPHLILHVLETIPEESLIIH